jgi:uncharacterized protein
MSTTQINIRLNDYDLKLLEKYQMLFNRGRAEVIRELIRSLEPKVKVYNPNN